MSQKTKQHHFIALPKDAPKLVQELIRGDAGGTPRQSNEHASASTT
jgi:hypothetical protein